MEKYWLESPDWIFLFVCLFYTYILLFSHSHKPCGISPGIPGPQVLQQGLGSLSQAVAPSLPARSQQPT